MIQIEKLSKKNLKQASELADKIFYYEEIKPSESFESSLNEKKFEELSKKTGIPLTELKYWVAKDQNTKKIVGTTGLYIDKRDKKEAVWLGWYCVDEKYRGKGIGQKLLKHIIKKTKRRRNIFLRLYTSTRPSEITAKIIYDKFGFKIMKEKEVKKDGGYDTYYMQLNVHL
ncbi:MAG: GNAT family N-acetyltransferase [bacterium]|nr:GNAT family N-acetyltransferase [bacterium]